MKKWTFTLFYPVIRIPLDFYIWRHKPSKGTFQILRRNNSKVPRLTNSFYVIMFWMNFVKRMQHFLLQFTCFLKRKWIWQKINNVFSNSVFRLNNEILITLHLYLFFLKIQYTNILFNQVPWNSSLEKVKLHCVKVIGPDSTSNSFMSTSGSRVQMWLFHTRHLADVYGSFTDQEMGRQLAGKSRLLLSFSFWYYCVHVTNTWCFEMTCIFWIYRRFKFPVKKSFQLVKVFLQDEY